MFDGGTIEEYYKSTSERAKQFFQQIPWSTLQLKTKTELIILYAGCGFAASAAPLLECIAAQTFRGTVRLILVDQDQSATRFAQGKLKGFSNKANTHIEVVNSDLFQFAKWTRDRFDIILFEHPVTDLITSLTIQLAHNLFPFLMKQITGTENYSGYSYRHAIPLLAKRLKKDGVVMGGCYTILEHQQLKALVTSTAPISLVQQNISPLSLIPWPFREYNTWSLFKKYSDTTVREMSDQAIVEHIRARDILYGLCFVFANIMVHYGEQDNLTLRVSLIFALSFYIQPILHNYTEQDLIYKAIMTMIESIICFLPMSFSDVPEHQLRATL